MRVQFHFSIVTYHIAHERQETVLLVQLFFNRKMGAIPVIPVMVWFNLISLSP